MKEGDKKYTSNMGECNVATNYIIKNQSNVMHIVEHLAIFQQIRNFGSIVVNMNNTTFALWINLWKSRGITFS